MYVVEGDPARATVVATHRRHALRRRRDAHALIDERLARHTIFQVTSHVCSNDSGGALLAGARRSIAIEPITGRSFTESPGRTVIGVARGETRGERRRHRSHASRTMHGDARRKVRKGAAALTSQIIDLVINGNGKT